MGLSQLYAEVVLSQMSPYRNTAERLKTAKKTHEIGKGLAHLDAEGVILPSSPYNGTAEGKSATKKSHKMEKSADKIGGFHLI